MSDNESLDYLQGGFDASSLTVPRLRSILVQYDVSFPSGAKKSQLIDIFNENIVPRSRKILNERARARRTNKGITNASGSEDDEAMPPPPTPKAKAPGGRRTTKTPSRASSRVKVEESEEDIIPVVTRSPIKKASSKHARPSDTESTDGTAKSARKTARKSEAPALPAHPEPGMRDEETERTRDKRRESNFTYDNPFQSGSSPPPSTERKRKSLTTPANKEKRKASSSTTRRKTDSAQADDGIHPPKSATFEVPVSKLNGLKSMDDNGVEAGEEFTPEEQLELVRERSEKGVSALGPLRPRTTSRRGFSPKKPLWVLAVTALATYAGLYRQEKIAVGYCGVGREATAIVPANLEVPDWVRILAEPECEVCPQHAYCSYDMQAVCEPDFVLKRHPLSLGGIIPLPPTCEPDGEKVRRVKAVADRAVEELRERRAKFECGQLVDEKGAPAPMVEIDAEQLKKDVSKKRNKKMGEAEFEELWVAAMGEIQGRDEVVSIADGDQHSVLLASTSLARLPLTCALRRSVRKTVAAHRLQLGSLTSFLLFIAYLRQQFLSRQQMKAQVPQLVSLTLDRLANQAGLHLEDREIEKYISIGQLRDDVLRDEHSISKREKLWQRVRQVVEMNANVRSSQREDRNGEVSRVWEWIGALGELESGGVGAAGRKRRSGGRVSWYSNHSGGDGEGEDRASSPVSGIDAGPEAVQRGWSEGRPIY